MQHSEWPWGQLGDHTRDEIELREKDTGRAPTWNFSNNYIAIRTDPVIFPDGRVGDYFSIHPVHGGKISGAVILPSFKGELVLCRQYRHAPRRWALEAPRGYAESGELPIQTARRELFEEYAVHVDEFVSLGSVNLDSGTFASDVACFWCELPEMPAAVGDDKKKPPVVMKPAELSAAIAAGEVNDAPLIVSFALATARKLIA